MHTLHRLIVLLCCAALVACTSLQTVASGRAAVESHFRNAPAGGVSPDSVQITLVSGEVLNAVIQEVGVDSITIVQGGQKSQLALERIEKLELQQFNATRTTLWVVGILTLIALGQYAAGLSKLLSRQ